MKNERKLDITAGLICVVLALLILFVAIPLGVQEPKKVKFVALSPSYYPRLVTYFLLFFGLLLVALRFFNKDTQHPIFENSFWRQNIKALLVIVAVLFLYYATLNYLGFVVSSIIALLALLFIAGERKLWALVLIPLGLPFALYYFFTHVANIPIPAGVLELWLVGG